MLHISCGLGFTSFQFQMDRNIIVKLKKLFIRFIIFVVNQLKCFVVKFADFVFPETIHINGASLNWHSKNALARKRAFSSTKHLLILQRRWTLKNTFLQRSSMCFLNLSWLLIDMSSNVTLLKQGIPLLLILSKSQMKLEQLWHCQKVRWNWNNYDLVKRSHETGTIMMLSIGQMKLEQLWHCQKVRWNWNSYGVIKRSDETGTNLTLEQIGTNLMLIWNKLWRCQKITWNWNNYDIVNWLV